MATLEEQVELEYRMVQSGIDRYQKQKDELEGKGLGSKTLHGRTIIKGVVEPAIEGVREIIEKKGESGRGKRSTAGVLLAGMDSGKVAYLTLVTVIDSLSSYHTILKVARMVGIQVETQKRLDTWLGEDRDVAGNMIRMAGKKSDKGFDHKRHGLNHKIKTDGLDIPFWSAEDRVKVGIKLIDAVIKETGIIKIVKRQYRRKQQTFLVATEETLEWVKAFNSVNETNLPRYAPCIIQPKPWESFWGGGYHSEHLHQLPLVRIHQ